MFRPLLAVFALLLSALSTAQAAIPIPAPPSVDARGYILVDYQTGRVLGADHPDDRMEPASLTKLMTAYIVFSALHDGRLKLTDQVTISEHAWRAEGSRTFLQVGTVVPVDILIKGMIVQSGNDATVALAEKIGGTESAFVELMNTYAKRLGMAHTHFADSNGLPDPNHYTTPRDLSILTRALIHDFPDYYPLFSLHDFMWNNIKQQNRNGLLSTDPTVDGLKTGHTDAAGYCLITSAKRDGMRLISVVLGSPSIKAREAASAALLNYGYTFYQTIKLKGAGDVLATPRVYYSDSKTADAGLKQDLYVTIGRDQAAGIKTNVTLTPDLQAPLAAGAPVGSVTFTTADGTTVAQAPLVTLKAVPEGGILTRLSDRLSLLLHKS